MERKKENVPSDQSLVLAITPEADLSSLPKRLLLGRLAKVRLFSVPPLVFGMFFFSPPHPLPAD